MDKSKLTELTARREAERAGGGDLAADDIGRIFDTLFGTVEHAGTIAEALKAHETVTLGSFGSFHVADGAASFRPGKALTEYLQDRTG